LQLHPKNCAKFLLFSKKKKKTSFCSGDHDISVPYVATLAWIRALDVDVFDEWRPWFVEGQIAG
jgi:serine carboxypeptidase-like clade 1